MPTTRPTFLFCSGLQEGQYEQFFRNTFAVLNATTASASDISINVFPDARCAWMIVKQRMGVGIHTFADRERAVILFGELFCNNEMAPNPAEAFASVWKKRGLCQANENEGSRNVIAVDLQTSVVHLCGDNFGRRGLSYWMGDMLLVSPHDTMLVAAGVEPKVDKVSLASLATFNAPIGEYTLLDDVRRTVPRSIIRWDWKQRKLEQRFSTPSRNDATSQKNIGAVVADSLVERVVQIANDGDVGITLTGGLDSRLALAAALKVVDRNKIRGVTADYGGCVDADIASRICLHYGLKHVRVTGAKQSPESLSRSIDDYAFYRSGCAHLGVLRAPQGLYDCGTTIGGAGGEILRGYYYGCGVPGKLDEQCTRSVIEQTSQSLNRKYAKNMQIDSELLAGVQGRVANLLNRFAETEACLAHVLDRFYVEQRFGRWADGGFTPWHQRHFSVFEHSRLADIIRTVATKAKARSLLHWIALANLNTRELLRPTSDGRLPLLLAVPLGGRVKVGAQRNRTQFQIGVTSFMKRALQNYRKFSLTRMLLPDCSLDDEDLIYKQSQLAAALCVTERWYEELVAVRCRYENRLSHLRIT